MRNLIEEFTMNTPTLASQWRSIILFGMNTSSYKFALAQALLDQAKEGKTFIALQDLAIPYTLHLCEHLKKAPKQSTGKPGKFIESCKTYNEDPNEFNFANMVQRAEKQGFNYVLDAFHKVNGETISEPFFEKTKENGIPGIVLTDEVHLLLEEKDSFNFVPEVEARWNLIETAWGLRLSRQLLDVHYDSDKQLFFVNQDFKRKDVTSARDALNGYQKGKCFYCYDTISLNHDDGLLGDVDHFFPHALKPYYPHINWNGIWNLVLACPQCNRGQQGKFAKIPTMSYLKRLHQRNEYLINSHHPLRETIIAQCGNTERDRAQFLNKCDNIAIQKLLHRWSTRPRGDLSF